jgi:hypothetical protein
MVSNYALKIEDLNANKSEQHRLAPLIEALATVLCRVSSRKQPEIKDLLERKASELPVLGM